MKKNFFVYLLGLVSLYSCHGDTKSSEQTQTDNVVAAPAIPMINYGVTKIYPHDTTLFTEGLVFHNGQLFESTGAPDELPQTRSLIGISNLADGKFSKKIEIDRAIYFGEGIVFLNNKLYQLTYLNQTGFVYDATTFKRIDSFRFANKQGWALTTDGTSIIMSDGTAALTYLDPNTLKPQKVMTVTANGIAQDSMNELEFIRGYIYANIWESNNIVKIDPANGKIVGKLDLSSLLYEAKKKYAAADVLNGIAYDSVADKIYVTGKLWPTIYEVKF